MNEQTRHISITLFIISILTSLVTNIATTVLPEYLIPYLWYSWPLLLVLVIIAILLMGMKDIEVHPKIIYQNQSPINKDIAPLLPEEKKTYKPKIIEPAIKFQKPDRTLLGIGITIMVVDFLYFLGSQTTMIEDFRFIVGQNIPLLLIFLGVIISYFGLVFGIPVFQWVIFFVGVYIILRYQIATDDWASWWYAWTLFPAFAGVGHLIDKFLIDLGWVSDYSETTASYKNVQVAILWTIILFLIVGVLFYGLFGIYGRISVILLIGLYFIWLAFFPLEKKKESNPWDGYD